MSKLTSLFFCGLLIAPSIVLARIPVVDNSAAAVESRLMPAGAGEVTVDASKPAVVASSGGSESLGEKIYKTNCLVCHAAGVAGAPKMGDKGAWAPRVAQGMDVLLSHAVKGFKAMPPKGTCASCSDADLKAAIEYMTK